MEFHSLSRKELQTLCKKNKIPANITNLAMADALAALPQVEGLDEFLNPTEADGVARTPDIHHHHPRTATRRKGIKEEPESLKVCSRVQRGSRAKKVEVEQDSSVMPPNSRRRALPVSTSRKKDEKEEEDDDDKNGVLLQTPAALPSSRSRATGRTPRGGTTSVQPSYSTRRSVRLLEKNLSKMSLLENEDMGPANIDHAISQDSTETQEVNDAGASLQTVSTAVSEETDQLEVSSLEKNTECEDSEIQLVSGAENYVGAGFQADPQEEGIGKVNCLEAEQHDSNLKLEGISETCDDSNEDMGPANIDHAISQDSTETQEVNDAGASLQTVSTAVSEETDQLEVSSLEKNTECEDSEIQLVSGAENYVGAGFQADPQEEGIGKVNCLEAEQHDSNLKLEGISETCDDSNEVGECCDDLAVDLKKSVAIEEDNEAGSELLPGVEAFSEPENKDWLGTKQDALSADASEDAFMELTEQDVAALSVEVPDDASLEVVDQCVAGLVPMSSASGDSVKLNDLVGGNTDNQGSNEYGDNQVKNNETADGNYIQNFEPMFDGDEKAADEKDLASSEEVLGLVSSNCCFSGEHQEEELKDKSEHSEDSIAEIEKMDSATDVTGASFTVFAVEKDAGFEAEDLNDNSEKLEAKAQPEDSKEDAFDVSGASSAILAVEMDATFENSTTVNEFCFETSAGKSIMDAENVAVESSLLDVGVHEAEDLKNNSEILESEALAEESEEHVAGEETLLDAASAFPSVLGGISNPHISLQISLESTGNSIDSCSSDALMSVLSCNSNTLVDGVDISEEIAIPKLEPSVLAETVAVAPIHERKISDIPVQSNVADQLKGESLFPAQSETKGFANETHMHNVNMMKENLTTNEFDKKSIGELKKLLKKLTLDGKSNCKSKTDNVVKQEVEKKRTTLQALPENRMTNMEAQNDG